MLVREVIDRTLTEWLYPGGIEKPAFRTLANGITNVQNQFDLTPGGYGDPDKNSIYEIDSELILGGDFAGVQVTANERGFRETDAVAHNAGTKVYVDPDFPRKTIENAVKTLIGDLFPWGAYRRVPTDAITYSTRGVKTMPIGTKDILSVVVRKQSADEDYLRLLPGREYSVFTEWDPPKLKLLSGGAENAAVRIIYSADYDLDPFTEDTDLTALGVSETLQPHLPMGVAGRVLLGRDVPRALAREIQRMLAMQSGGVPPGALSSIAQGLIEVFKRMHVGAERERLDRLDPPNFRWVGPRGR